MRVEGILLALVAGCSPSPAKLSIQPDRVLLSSKDATQSLKAVVTSKAGDALDVPVEWHSLDEKICAVDARGVVRGLRSGQCVVRAMAGDLRTDAAVRVAFIGHVEIDPPEVQMLTGGTRGFSAHVLDDQGGPMIAVGVTWSSSNPAVARVDAAGNVKTLDVGEAVISASTKDGAVGQSHVTVAEKSW